MRSFSLMIMVFFIAFNSNAQYYLRGEIKDEKDQLLQNVEIILLSNKTAYNSRSSGSFGISTDKLKDSLLLRLDGYQPLTIAVRADIFQQLRMKPALNTIRKNDLKLVSLTKGMGSMPVVSFDSKEESYFSIVDNNIISAEKFPNTGFSLNVNKAAYSNIRRFINDQRQVPPDAVRIEEMLNYFNLHYQEPENKNVFKIASQLADCPWNTANKLLYLNINARKLTLDTIPPSNLVFLIDASGSMDIPNSLPLVKAGFQMLVKNLRKEDTVSIVVCSGTAIEWLKPTSGAEKEKIIQSIEELKAADETPGAAAIELAYQMAKKSFIKKGNNRVILATDGDFNVGESSEKSLEDLISRERKSGIYLTCLGVGIGNFKDSKLETLAKKGNGNYAYLDNLQEAEKVLVKEVTQNFYTVATNALLNIYFNADMIKSYRLIGFDNKKEAIHTDTTGSLEGREIGSGNGIMAIYEVTMADKFITYDSVHTIADVSLKYNLPENTISNTFQYSCKNNLKAFTAIDKDLQFAEPEYFTALCSRRYFYFSLAINCWHFYLCTKNSFRKRKVQVKCNI
ncbi:MAG: von Willebrand factor type A domain-containing protein [Sphingobacteriales bacterium]|nr:von Willebrand factor type A domain-containing protein [Sphingobacteriales bacterium]